MSRRTHIMTPKWSQKQDDKLRQAVQKYGTQWSVIIQKYKFQRSINSIIKRWHCKLKDQMGTRKNLQLKQQTKQKQSLIMPQKSKRIKKQIIKQYIKVQSQEQINQVEQNYQSLNPISQQEQKSQHNQTLSFQIQTYIFQHEWKQDQDQLLKELVINQKILNWDQLGRRLKINNIREVRRRWQKKIYPMIIDSKKIGGCVKYSDQEDAILSRGVKIGLGIQELRKFLPSRTLYSLDARRRRTLRFEEETEKIQLRFWKKKMLADKFVEKRHEHLQKPVQEDDFLLYRSESE